MSKVTATDANRYFSKLLKRVEKGERITITKDGKPVAVLAPLKQPEPTNEQREAALKRLKEMIDKGGLDIEPIRNRDELYRR